MTRRPLVLAVLAGLALGAAWWYFATGLSAKERMLVGTWHYSGNGNLIGPYTMSLSVQRECQVRFGFQAVDVPPCQLSARSGTIAFDYERSAFRRLLRPVADRIGVAVGPVAEFPMHATGDAIFIRSPVGVTVYARVPAE
jgi:hypothetical protein